MSFDQKLKHMQANDLLWSSDLTKFRLQISGQDINYCYIQRAMQHKLPAQDLKQFRINCQELKEKWTILIPFSVCHFSHSKC